MNSALKRTSIAATLFIIVLMINLNYVQGSQADKLQKDPHNSRKYADIFTKPRGKIIAGGDILAYSKPVGNGQSKNQKYQRFYNDGAIFYPVTGYFSSTGLRNGLETAYDGMLSGKQSTQSWFDSFVGKKPMGADVYTTIDPRAQRVAYNELAKVTDRRGAAVVIDIKTGAIKVAASYPSFDTNTVSATNSGKQANDEFTKLQAKNTMAGNINRAFGELFPPGSSFKSVVAATALQTGQYNAQTPVPAPFSAPIPLTHLSVSNDGHGACDSAATPLIETFAQSCNTTYALLGQQILGPQKVHDQAAKFGFYQPIAIEPDLNSAPSSYPNKLDAAKVFLGSFGQGETKATPLQMAMVASAIADNGTMMKPYLVQDVKRIDGSDVYTANPSEFGKPISADSAGQLQQMMKAVVDHGTAANLNGKNIAGKTGTAELDGNNRGLWFVGFAPANAPKIAFAVMIEGTKGDFGATKSGPVATTIVQQVLAAK